MFVVYYMSMQMRKTLSFFVISSLCFSAVVPQAAALKAFAMKTRNGGGKSIQLDNPTTVDANLYLPVATVETGNSNVSAVTPTNEIREVPSNVVAAPLRSISLPFMQDEQRGANAPQTMFGATQDTVKRDGWGSDFDVQRIYVNPLLRSGEVKAVIPSRPNPVKDKQIFVSRPSQLQHPMPLLEASNLIRSIEILGPQRAVSTMRAKPSMNWLWIYNIEAGLTSFRATLAKLLPTSNRQPSRVKKTNVMVYSAGLLLLLPLLFLLF